MPFESGESRWFLNNLHAILRSLYTGLGEQTQRGEEMGANAQLTALVPHKPLCAKRLAFWYALCFIELSVDAAKDVGGAEERL
jgi:hypothetical protein